jgi:hypothetical protein
MRFFFLGSIMPGTSVFGGYEYSDDLATRMENHRGEVGAADTKEVGTIFAYRPEMMLCVCDCVWCVCVCVCVCVCARAYTRTHASLRMEQQTHMHLVFDSLVCVYVL